MSRVTTHCDQVLSRQGEREGLETRVLQAYPARHSRAGTDEAAAVECGWRPERPSIPSSNQLEALKGDRKGEYSIRINKQWRICFKWRDGHAFDVEIVDYH
jgi:proteic killer suppression protein